MHPLLKTRVSTSPHFGPRDCLLGHSALDNRVVEPAKAQRSKRGKRNRS
jgi:hypothetical protein